MTRDSDKDKKRGRKRVGGREEKEGDTRKGSSILCGWSSLCYKEKGVMGAGGGRIEREREREREKPDTF
jgi:hypothetical protein